MEALLKIIVDVFSKRTTWIIIGVLFLLVLLYSVFSRFYQTASERFDKPNITDDSSTSDISKAERDKIDSLAQSLNFAMSEINWFGVAGSTDGILKEISELNDASLKMLSKKYRNSYGQSMYNVIDSQILPYTDFDDIILTKLDRLAEKY